MPKKLFAVCAVGFGAVAVFASVDASRPAKAWLSPYAWCANFGNAQTQATSCDYYTFEQCQVAVSGVGGRCHPNPAYAPAFADPDGPPPQRKHRRRHP